MRYFADYIKGKPYQKTVLWENSSPTSAFANQTVTLSDNMKNYDQICVVFAYSKDTSNNNSYISETTYKISDFIRMPAGNVNDCKASLGCYYSNAGNFCRMFGYVDNTSIFFTQCILMNSSGTNNQYCIPLKIIGIKKGLGECVKIKTGTLSFMLAETTKEIDTGLSEINKFMLFARHSDAEISTSAVQCSLLYDADKSISTHCIVGSLGTGSSYSTSNPQQAIGTSVQRGITINSIVDGKVTISNSGANNANWNDWGVVYWVAIGE